MILSPLVIDFVPYGAQHYLCLQQKTCIRILLGKDLVHLMMFCVNEMRRGGLYKNGSMLQQRISVARQEMSLGRPVHTPIRRSLACMCRLEDRDVGQKRRAGRLGTMPF